MNNKTKFRIALTIGLVGVGTYLYKTRLTRTKALVESVWDEIKDDLVAKLELPKMPVLKYCTLESAVMSTEHTYYYTTPSFMDKRITKTVSSFVINVDLEKVFDLIGTYKSFILNPLNNKIARDIVQQLLVHECRHIWQANGDFYVGTKIEMFRPLFEGYGNQRHEKDANEFAIEFARNDRERAVALCQKAIQEHTGTVDGSLGILCKEVSSCVRNLKKVYS